MRSAIRIGRRAFVLVCLMLGLSAGIAQAGIVNDEPCEPQNVQFLAGYADMVGGGYSYKCSLIGQHGNYANSGTTAYAQVYYDGYQNVPVPCQYVGVQVTYAYGGTLYAAARANATYHQWGQSAPTGANRFIVGSTFFATRDGYYNYSTSIGAIGC